MKVEIHITEEDIFVETSDGNVLIGKVNGGNADIFGNAYKYISPFEVALIWKSIKEDHES